MHFARITHDPAVMGGRPGLDQEVLRSSRSRQGLIAHGEHLTHRCSGWTEDLHRHRGWAPEVA